MSLHITALTDPAHGTHSRRLAWLASNADSIPVGTAFLRLLDGGQEHSAELTLHVHPTERRQGVGSRLLDTAVTAARDDSRRCVSAQAEAGSPGDRFLIARGFRKVLTLRFARLPLAQVDLTALTEIIERPHPGYRLASWQGTVPDDLAQTFAASRRAMDDMPMEDAEYDPVAWDVDRVRAAAKAIEQRGDQRTRSSPSTSPTTRSSGSPNSSFPAAAREMASTTAPACCPSIADTASADG